MPLDRAPLPPSATIKTTIPALAGLAAGGARAGTPSSTAAASWPSRLAALAKRHPASTAATI